MFITNGIPTTSLKNDSQAITTHDVRDLNQYVVTNPIDSIESKSCLTIPSVAKAALVAIGTIGTYYLAKTTNVLSYFDWGSKNPIDVNGNELVKVRNEEQSLVARRSLEQPQIFFPTDSLQSDEKIVEFDEIEIQESEIQEFENLPKVKRRVEDRRSISIQNPIPNQNVMVGNLFELTINGATVFNSNTIFVEATNIPTWMTSSSVNSTLKGSYDTLNRAYDVALSGNYAYIADGGSGLQIIDISDPTNPTFIGSYDTPDTACGIDLLGNYAYVAAGFSGLQIIDVSNLANPTFIGSYDTTIYAWSVTFSGNNAYVAAASSGLQIIDITDPANPTFKSSYDTPNDARDVAISGNYAYVADQVSGLQIINITDPANPTFKGSYNTPQWANGIALSGNYAYVADGSGGLQIIDITDPANPIFKCSYNTPGSAADVAISGNYAYVADATSGLQIIDISDPANSTFKGSYDTPDMAYGIALLGNYAYMAGWTSGLQIIETNLDKLILSGAPNSVGTYSIDINGCNEINECITNSFNIIVTNPITNPTDSSNTTVIIVSSVAGTVCIIGLCSLSIIGGIIALRKCRKKKMKKRKIVKKDHCNPIIIFFKKLIGINVLPTKIERKNQIVAENSLQPVIQQHPEVFIEYDLNAKGEKVPTAPDYEDRSDVELVDTMPQGLKSATAPELSGSSEEIWYDESDSFEEIEVEIVEEIEYYEDIPQNFIGPISQDIMQDPCMLAETGQTYEKKQIMTWLSKNNTDPLTRAKLTSKQIIPNIALRNSIEDWKEKHEVKKI